MGQVSAKLRRAEGGYAHWCPGCERMHVVPDGWEFDGDVERPTFKPSVRITYNGCDAGQLRDGKRAPSACCHYTLTAGKLQFCGDSTHALAGKTVPLPPLPEGLRD
jgi:hypothetical protein